MLYADFSFWESGSRIRQLNDLCQQSLTKVEKWCDKWGFQISQSKSAAVLFTNKRNLPHICLKLQQHSIPVRNEYKFLGITFQRNGTYCCDWKSRATCAQNFAPWQQATIEFTCHDHSIIACSRHIHIFLFFAHIQFVVNHRINATPPERLQQHPLLFTTNHTDRTFYV